MNLLEFDITIPTKNISHFMKTFQEHNWLKTKIKEDEAHEKAMKNACKKIVEDEIVMFT